MITYAWRGPFTGPEISALHAGGFGGQPRAAGCQWLHVDFEDHLRPFYFGGCGFKPANAGLIALQTRRRG